MAILLVLPSDKIIENVIPGGEAASYNTTALKGPKNINICNENSQVTVKTANFFQIS